MLKLSPKLLKWKINNPLIDDYTLKGAKGLLVNKTGGKDLDFFLNFDKKEIK